MADDACRNVEKPKTLRAILLPEPSDDASLGDEMIDASLDPVESLDLFAGRRRGGTKGFGLVMLAPVGVAENGDGCETVEAGLDEWSRDLSERRLIERGRKNSSPDLHGLLFSSVISE